MMETRFLVAYREAHAGLWYDVAGCDHLDTCQELAGNGAKAHPHRQYAVFRNEPGWWMGLPRHVAGLSDRELCRHTYGADLPADDRANIYPLS